VALFLGMGGGERLAGELAGFTSGETGQIEFRSFPDGESYVRILSDVGRRDIFLVADLARADDLFLPLMFAARTLRGLEARRIGLIAPYLPYMRQDMAFRPGEALSSSIFADLISREFDELVTVDPHLHRRSSLDEIFSVPSTVVHSAPAIGQWIRDRVNRPLIVGPDSESAQWVEEVARIAGAPSLVLTKERLGDRSVRLQAAPLDRWRDRSPVLVDDIISSGTTMTEAAKLLVGSGLAAPLCIAVHGLFGASPPEDLLRASSALLTTDTVPNPLAMIPVARPIAEAVMRRPRRIDRKGARLA
jgi:ribose-phosphate pyrophosphokinase